LEGEFYTPPSGVLTISRKRHNYEGKWSRVKEMGKINEIKIKMGGEGSGDKTNRVK
jgi:hypothetical protein